MKKILFICLFLFSCSDYNDCKTLYVFFDNVEGLDENSIVIYKGLKVGKIENLEFCKNKVLVKIKVNILVPKKSFFYIKDRGVLSRCIHIEGSDNSGFYLKNNDTIYGQICKKQELLEKIIKTSDSLQ